MRFNGVLFPIATPRITMPFGATDTKWYSDERPHRGVDIAPFPGSHGEPVYAPMIGQIHHAGDHPYAGLELTLKTALPYPFSATALDGYVYEVAAEEVFALRMTHHSEILVSPEDDVMAGEEIAYIGSTGRYTTGPHVHMELHQLPGGIHGPVRHLDPIDLFIAATPGLREVLVRPW